MSTTEGPSSPAPGAARRPETGRENPEPAASGSRGRRKIQAGIAVLAVIAAGVFGYWFIFMRGIVFTDDARFSGHLVDLAPEINGRLIDVAVHEGMFVRKGTVVFRLDPAMLEAALNQAEASLTSARANLGLSEALYEKTVNGSRPEEIRAAEATVKRLQDEEEMAGVELERTQALFKGSAVSKDDLDRARTAFESAQQSRENAGQNLSVLQEGSRKEDIAAAKAAVELARSRIAEVSATVENARRNLARCTVRGALRRLGCAALG